MNNASSQSAIVDVTNFDLKQAPWHCDQLERGKVLFFSHVPFAFPEADREFLLSQKQTGSRFHKNISYTPAKDLLKGVDENSPDRERMSTIMPYPAGRVDLPTPPAPLPEGRGEKSTGEDNSLS